MENLSTFTIIHSSILAFYFIATFLFLASLIFQKTRWLSQVKRLQVIGLLAQTIYLITHFLDQNQAFFQSSFDTYQMLSVSSVFLSLILSLKLKLVAPALLPLGLIYYILSLSHTYSLSTPFAFLANPWASIHLFFILIAFTIFIMSLLIAIVYLLQEYRFKNHKYSSFWDRLPSLESLEKVHYRALYAGFIIYTAGIITGAGWSKSIKGVYIEADIKEMASLALWLFFALFLNLRIVRGWVGQRGIFISSLGFIAAIILMMWI